VGEAEALHRFVYNGFGIIDELFHRGTLLLGWARFRPGCPLWTAPATMNDTRWPVAFL
jgi:hypothetical protein